MMCDIDKREDAPPEQPPREGDKDDSIENRAEDEEKPSLSVGDAVAEWIRARDRGQVPRERYRPNSARIGRIDTGSGKCVTILFCDRDNNSSSVVADVIFSALVSKEGLQDRVKCFSAGTHVPKGSVGGVGSVGHLGDTRDGMLVTSGVVEALRHRWKVDVSKRMAVGLDGEDLGGYNLVCCLDEATRSRVMYMLANDDGKLPDDIGERITVLSSYAKDERLRTTQWRSGQYSREGLKILCQGIADACEGLLDLIVQEIGQS